VLWMLKTSSVYCPHTRHCKAPWFSSWHVSKPFFRLRLCRNVSSHGNHVFIRNNAFICSSRNLGGRDPRVPAVTLLMLPEKRVESRGILVIGWLQWKQRIHRLHIATRLCSSSQLVQDNLWSTPWFLDRFFAGYKIIIGSSKFHIAKLQLRRAASRSWAINQLIYL
jgi:hypothetical protein